MMLRLVKVTVFAGLWMGLSAFAQDAAGGAAAAGTNMGVLQPAVMTLQQAMDSLRVDKWKASKDVKAATADNIGSIRRDVEQTLPGLVTAADATPGSLAAMLPLTRNLGALYDVVLRVTVIAESAAPGDQADALQKSLSNLESAKRTLADRQQQMAVTEESKAGDLQKQLSARPAVAAVCPPVVAAVPVKTPAASAKRKKVAPKKTSGVAAKPAGSGTSK